MNSILMEAALRSVVVAVAVGAGLGVLRVRNVPARKLAWGLVLGASALMPLLLPMAARWQVAQVSLPQQALMRLRGAWQRLQSPPEQVVPAPAAAPLPDAALRAASPMKAAAPVERADDAVRIAPGRYPAPAISQTVGSAPQAAPQRRSGWRMGWRDLAVLVYAGVLAALLFRLVYGLGAAVRLWQTAEAAVLPEGLEGAAGMAVRASTWVASPVTIGSGVVLPADYAEWDEEKLRIVLAHEHAHIRQGDFYLQLAAALYAALVWFSPLGWWLKRKLSDLAEAISDRAGLAEASSNASYAQILLEFAAAPRPTAVGVAMAQRGNLSRRIERLLHPESFAQSFAGGRGRLLASVALVPLALFAATTLVRVQAAGQAGPQSPAAAASAAPAPAAPADLSGTAHPDEAPPEATMPADTDLSPVTPVAPAEPAAVPAPPVPPVFVTGVGSDTVTTVGRGRALTLLGRNGTVLSSGDGNSYAASGGSYAALGSSYARGSYVHGYSQGGHGYVYAAGGAGQQNNDSFAFVTQGGHRYSGTGSFDNSARDLIGKASAQTHGDFLWFTRDGKSYMVDDPAVLARINALYAPMEELGKKQEALGREQEALGKQQEAIARRQQQASVPVPDMQKQLANLDAAMANLRAKMGQTVTQEQLSELQERLGDLQGRLGDLQSRIGDRMGEFGEQQGKLGAAQGKLGEAQGKLGEQMGKMAEAANRQVRSVIDQSLKSGKARPVQ